MGHSLISHLALANLAAAGAILLVLMARPVSARWLGARMTYALWLIVPVAMLANLAPPRIVELKAPVAVPSVVVVRADRTGSASTPAPLPLRRPPPDPALILTALWLTGAAAFGAHLAIAQRRAVARLGAVTPIAAGLSRAANAGTGPVLLGVMRPRVVVPADFEARFDPREQAMILAHEQTHRAGGDTRINALIALVRALCWFNPLVHLGARYVRVDQELACDAAVVGQFPGERRTYAQALLKTQLAGVPLPLGCYWPGRSHNLLKERIEMLALDTPGRIRLTTGVAIIAAASLGAGLAAWAAQPPEVRLVQSPFAGALGAPAQGKISSPAPARTNTPGAGGVSLTPVNSAALKAAIEAGDVDAALAAGATAGDVANMILSGSNRRFNVRNAEDYDPNRAAFVRGGSNLLSVVIPERTSGYVLMSLTSSDSPPPSVESLPTAEDLFSPPSFYPLGQMIQNGASARDAAVALLADMPAQLIAAATSLDDTSRALDPSTARFIRTADNHGVALGMTSSDGVRFLSTGPPPYTASYPWLAGLPTLAQAFPIPVTGAAPTLAPAPAKPLPEIPTDWLPKTPAKPG